MKFFHNHIVAPLATAIYSLAVAVLATTISMAISGCAADSTSLPSSQDTNGVIIVGEIIKEVNAGENTISRTATTSAAYTTSCDADWVEVTANASAAEAGLYSIKIAVAKNSTGADREATVNITVEGFEQTPLVNIKQLSIGSKDPIINWMNAHLSSEYLWLDEYNQKSDSFDYTLSYELFLEKSLLSLQTNGEDGGIDENGERYLFSFVESMGTDSFVNSQANSIEKSYGFELSPVPLKFAGGQAVALVVDNVFEGSPAHKAKMERGDWIISVDRAEITTSNYREMWEQLQEQETTSSVTLTWRTAFTEDTETTTLQKAEVVENPLAEALVLDLSIWPEFDGKKVGYIAYTSFNADFRAELIQGFRELQAEGITDLIVDLTSSYDGEVFTSSYMASMILDESYVGSYWGMLDRHEQNPIGDTEIHIQAATNDATPITLPHLNLSKVYILTTSRTAFTAEALISSLRGLDFEVVVVGEQHTYGKNCGMDLYEEKIGSMWYRFTPVTFYLLNAKGEKDYADGIAADIDIATLYDMKDYATSNRARLYSIFPSPLGTWDNIYLNIPLQAALIDIIGADPKQDFFKLDEMEGNQIEFTRSATSESSMVEPMRSIEHKSRGMYVTQEGIEANKRRDK